MLFLSNNTIINNLSIKIFLIQQFFSLILCHVYKNRSISH